MIKIAVASENEMVTEHFGHCAHFNIYEAEDNRIVKSESISNPGQRQRRQILTIRRQIQLHRQPSY
jgi:predicted Fe-Mo cluster-binding NifX family protein